MKQNKHITNSNFGEKWFFSLYANIFWTALAIIILVLVFSYDHRGIQTVHELQTTGKNQLLQGNAHEAIDLYKKAYEHKRASNRKKGELALQIADIYLNDFGNDFEANHWYMNAKKHSPRVYSSQVSSNAKRDKYASTNDSMSSFSEHEFILPKPSSYTKGASVASCHGIPITDIEIKTVMGVDKLTSDVIGRYLEDEVLLHESINRGFYQNEQIQSKIYSSKRQALINAYLDSVASEGTTTSTSIREDLLKRLDSHKNTKIYKFQ
ncbi:MAG: hypothetical protein PHX74_02960 [Candidatus Sumerlaeales bacterium]|nr:hypothetical protein [Candidatus Sumerlaeales bacterium]